MFSFWRWSKV